MSITDPLPLWRFDFTLRETCRKEARHYRAATMQEAYEMLDQDVGIDEVSCVFHSSLNTSVPRAD